MVLPVMIGAALVGGGLGAGSELIQGKAQADLERRGSRRQAALGNLFQQSLNNDPLMQMILAQQQGPESVFNRRDVFRQASGQIDAALTRRSRDSLKNLAGFGFDMNDPQMAFMQKRLERLGTREMGNLNAMLNMAQEQYGAQQALASAGEMAGGIGSLKQLQVGAL